MDCEPCCVSPVEHVVEMLLRLVDMLLSLQLLDLGVIGNLVHPLDDSVHEWVKSLHDV